MLWEGSIYLGEIWENFTGQVGCELEIKMVAQIMQLPKIPLTCFTDLFLCD